jgi:hypothetical protein
MSIDSLLHSVQISVIPGMSPNKGSSCNAFSILGLYAFWEVLFRNPGEAHQFLVM